MECKLDKMFEETQYMLLMGKVVHLEVVDDIYRPDGSWDLEKAKPLMMAGSDTAMRYCTVTDTGKSDPFGAMFPDGKDPMAKMYEE
jgi:flavin reductase (DIM6/NTAB) family NADH-FMN oxidoreductase RutF